MSKPEWNAALRQLFAVLPDNLDRKILLGRYADSLGLTERDIKSRYPGFDVALSVYDDFEDLLAYFAQDLLVDRVGAKAATQASYDATVGEVLRAMIADVMKNDFAETMGTA